MAIIYHVTSPADWEQGRQADEYTTSTRGKTLADVGFLHASTATQIALVAGFIRQDDPDEPLVILVVDTDRLTSLAEQQRGHRVQVGPHPRGLIVGELTLDQPSHPYLKVRRPEQQRELRRHHPAQVS